MQDKKFVFFSFNEAKFSFMIKSSVVSNILILIHILILTYLQSKKQNGNTDGHQHPIYLLIKEIQSVASRNQKVDQVSFLPFDFVLF